MDGFRLRIAGTVVMCLATVPASVSPVTTE
jgi:hypothetical protein